jgi:hypothetical protein
VGMMPNLLSMKVGRDKPQHCAPLSSEEALARGQWGRGNIFPTVAERLKGHRARKIILSHRAEGRETRAPAPRRQ